MAERYDYYSNHPEDRYERDQNADRDAYLDNRTGVGAQGRGYRASFDRGRGGNGHESRSFRPPEDYGIDRGYRVYEEDYPGAARGYGGSDDLYRERYPRSVMPAFSPGFGFGPDMTDNYSAYPSYYYGPYATPFLYQGSPMPPRPTHGPHPRNFWDRAGDAIASWMGDEEARRRHLADQRTHNHQGKGPKAYKRSDARIHDDVNDRLTDDPWIDATHVEVKVQDTEVTLSGTVAHRDDKRHAERIAEHVSGVGHVQNNLRVDPGLAGGGTEGPGVNAALDRQAQGGRH